MTAAWFKDWRRTRTKGQVVQNTAGILARALERERERWLLWLPVALGAGVGVYFSLPMEPPLALVLAASGLLLLAAGLTRRAGSVIVAVMAAGFAAASMRTVSVAAPVLARRIGPVTVQGRIILAESFPQGTRLTLERLRIPGIGPMRTPERARIRLRGVQPDVHPGDWVRLRAVLSPPPSPAAPGAFDFQRRAYFRKLGAVGYGLGPAAVTRSGAGSSGFTLAVAKLRHDLSERIYKGAGAGIRGALAEAMMTGVRSAIPLSLMKSIRNSGLAHLLAISGLHVGLVAGILFVGLRALLALVPPIALRYPIKKWSAAAALLGALAYSIISGATVPTQRAFLMIGLVLLAVMVDRRGLSMRMVAWAAAVILLFRPESLLGASFQLSFAAVTALIAAYEVLRQRRIYGAAGPRPWFRVFLIYLGGVALTTLIAGMATAPFAIYNFNRLAAFGLAANLVGVPVTALWIMPLAVAAFALMPFGLESLALVPMGWGLDVLVWVAKSVSAWPGAITLIPAMPTWGLVGVAIGGLWLTIWRTRWRLLGGPVIVAGLASVFAVTPPDVLIGGRGKVMAVRSADGGLMVSDVRKSKFGQGIWLRRAGLKKAEAWPRQGYSRDRRLICDGLGCIYRKGGVTVALSKNSGALVEDCRMADLVVSLEPVRGKCPAPLAVIDRFDLWRNGAYAVWIGGGGGVRIESANGKRGNRPWVHRPEKRKTGGT
jgi:competence protein ComEC